MTACLHCKEDAPQPEIGMLCLRCAAPLVSCVRCVARLLADLRRALGDRAKRAITEATLIAAARGELEAKHAC